MKFKINQEAESKDSVFSEFRLPTSDFKVLPTLRSYASQMQNAKCKMQNEIRKL